MRIESVLASLLPLAIVVGSATAAQSQPTTTFEDLGRVIAPGDAITLTDARGQRTKGRLSELSPSELVVVADEARRFNVSEVGRIDRADGLWNGVLIGAATGAAIGLGGALASRGSEPNGYYWLYIGLWAAPAAGAAAGALVDRASTATVYVAPPRASRAPVVIAPSMAEGRTALLVGWKF
jgi:hypothetical protein